MPKPAVTTKGLDEVADNLGDVSKQLPRGMEDVHDDLSASLVADARARAPRRTGRLADTVRAEGLPEMASLTAGGPGVEYAPTIIYGGYPGDYPGNPFLTDAVEAAGDLSADYDRRVSAWLENVWKDN